MIAKAGKPLVKVAALDDPPEPRRLGFLAGEIAVPEDFNRMGEVEIAASSSLGGGARGPDQRHYAAAIPVQVSVYADKLLIWNPGHLPQGWTLAHLTQKHASYPFNPDIANTPFRAAYLESWGRGIEMIRQACQEHGCPEPLLRWDNGLWVEFRFAGTLQVTAHGTAQVTGQVRETPVETPETLVEGWTGTAQETTEERALALLRAEPTTPITTPISAQRQLVCSLLHL